MVYSLRYISVSTTIFRSIPCDTFDDGSELLVSDLSIDCTTASHARYEFAAYLGVVFFVLGVPFTFLCVLSKQRSSAGFSAVAAALAESYRDECVYTEALVCLQKVIHTSILALATVEARTHV